MASLYALEFPERLDRLVLLSPPTVLRPSLGLYARAILYGTVPSRSYIRRYLYWYAPDCVRHEDTRATIDEMVDEEVLARRCFKIKKREIVRPTVLSEEDWQRPAVPTLFLVGRNDVWVRSPAILGTLSIGFGLFWALREFDAARAAQVACLYLLSPIHLIYVIVTTDTALIVTSFWSLSKPRCASISNA